MGFWDTPEATVSEPLSEATFLDFAADIAGDRSPDLRDKLRRKAVEARADAFLRTLAEVRDL